MQMLCLTNLNDIVFVFFGGMTEQNLSQMQAISIESLFTLISFRIPCHGCTFFVQGGSYFNPKLHINKQLTVIILWLYHMLDKVTFFLRGRHLNKSNIRNGRKIIAYYDLP